MWKSCTQFAVVAGAVAGLLTVLVPPVASADIEQGFIAGTNSVSDDFHDEAELTRYNAYRVSGAVGLWQMILHADGFLTAGGVDCEFGSNTETATRNWQAWRGVGVDGRVGPQTWRAANEQVERGSASDEVNYRGRNRFLPLERRTSDGRYAFWDNNALRGANYFLRTCS